MKLIQGVFDTALINHKILIGKLSRIKKSPETEAEIKKSYPYFSRVRATAKELALASSGLCCQKCKAQSKLTFHHLIMRKAKEYMPFDRYATQRNYWANILVLCVECHAQYHGFVDREEKNREEVGTINPALIAKVEYRFFEKEETL